MEISCDISTWKLIPGFPIKTITIYGKTNPPVYDRIDSLVSKTLRNCRGETYQGITFQWFVNGSFQATGVKDITLFIDLLQNRELFRGIQLMSLRTAMVYIQTSIEPTNLCTLRNHLKKNLHCHVSYDWDRFKGIIAKELETKTTLLLYRSGKVGIFTTEYEYGVSLFQRWMANFVSQEKTSKEE